MTTARILIALDDHEPAVLETIEDADVDNFVAALRSLADKFLTFALLREIEENPDA